VDHVTVYRWVQRFTPEFIEAARPCRHAPGGRWFVDETYVKVSGRWTYLYPGGRPARSGNRRAAVRAAGPGRGPAVLRPGAARGHLSGRGHRRPGTGLPAGPRWLIPSALHTTEEYANNRVEADHGRLKARLRPVRSLKRHRSARILAAGRVFVQNSRRGHYELANDAPARHRLRIAFDQLTVAI
jgi:IS6 family transposase